MRLASRKNKIIWIKNKYSFAFVLLFFFSKNQIPPKYCEHLRSCAWTYSINNTSLWHRYLCFCLNDSKEFTHSVFHMYTHQRTFGFGAKSLYGKLTRIIECVYRENFLTEPVSALRRTLDPSLNVNLSLVCQDVCRESSEGETATQKRDKNEGKQNKILHFLSVKAKGRCSFRRAFWNSLFIFSLIHWCFSVVNRLYHH